MFVLNGPQCLDFFGFGKALGIKKYIRTQRGHKKIFGPVLLVCSINSQENTEITLYYTMVRKDSFETA